MTVDQFSGQVPLHVVGKRRPDETLTISVTGDLDILSSAVFRAKVKALLRQPPSGVELDLSEVTFMDATGAREILRHHQSAVQRKLRWVTVAASLPVLLILRLLELAELLPPGGP